MTIWGGIPAPRNDWTILALHDMQEITISRSTGAYSSTTGRYVDGTPVETTTQAVVYSATGKLLERLPENRRSQETLVIFSIDLLKTSDAGSNEADVLSGLPAPWDGVTWEVQNVKSWPGQNIGYESLAQRLEQ